MYSLWAVFIVQTINVRVKTWTRKRSKINRFMSSWCVKISFIYDGVSFRAYPFDRVRFYISLHSCFSDVNVALSAFYSPVKRLCKNWSPNPNSPTFFTLREKYFTVGVNFTLSTNYIRIYLWNLVFCLLIRWKNSS